MHDQSIEDLAEEMRIDDRTNRRCVLLEQEVVSWTVATEQSFGLANENFNVGARQQARTKREPIPAVGATA